MKETPITGDYILPAGSILHHAYRIDQLLGKGGFAIIYRATELSTGKVVAIKEYFPSDLAKREYKQDLFFVQPLPSSVREFRSGYAHFLEEAHILKKCRSLPGIVHVYEFFEEHQTAYIIMEYIDGPTLEQYISTNGVFSTSDLFELFLPLIDSLKQIHAKGLIHQDISPDNLILGMDNHLTLIDFGASRKQLSNPSKKHTIILKKNYAPPEQYQFSGNIGTWSDIYALCATMYFALSAHAPVSALERLQCVPFIPLSARISISPCIAGVIERGLSLNPADRYKTAEELHYALTHPEVSQQNRTVINLPDSAEKTRSFGIIHFPIRNVLFRRTLPLLTLFLLLGGSLFFWQNRMERAPRHSLKQTESSSDSTPASVKSAENSVDIAPAPTKHAAIAPAPTKATAMLTMENVIGLTKKKAVKKLNHLDPALQIQIEKAPANVKKGTVCDQSIAGGTTYYAGSITSITLTVSLSQKKKERKATVLPSPSDKLTANRSQKTSKTQKTPVPKKQNKDFQIITKPKKNTFEIE